MFPCSRCGSKEMRHYQFPNGDYCLDQATCRDCDNTDFYDVPERNGKLSSQERQAAASAKKSGRGGKRPGAGRPYLELHQEYERKVSKTITLSKEDWELLERHCTGTLSEGIHALLHKELEHMPNGTEYKGWSVVGRLV